MAGAGYHSEISNGLHISTILHRIRNHRGNGNHNATPNAQAVDAVRLREAGGEGDANACGGGLLRRIGGSLALPLNTGLRCLQGDGIARICLPASIWSCPQVIVPRGGGPRQEVEYLTYTLWNDWGTRTVLWLLKPSFM